MQISGVTIQGGMNILPAGGSPAPSPSGASYGYFAGGLSDAGVSTIQSFSFSSDGNASNVGNLSRAVYAGTGQSSSSSGYASGGYSTLFETTIDKWPFASNGTASDVGDLTVARSVPAGQSSSDNGYSSGGAPGYNTIDKFPFSSDGNATDVGDLTQNTGYAAGQNSSSHGYVSGGHVNSPTSRIEKFSFASDGNGSTVGDLTAAKRGNQNGQSSSDNGYHSGGLTAPSLSWLNVIEKFPFSSDSNASDIGDLTVGRADAAGSYSSSSGYLAGGISSVDEADRSNVIDKFPFSSDANATDVGDLTVAIRLGSGNQG